MSATRSFAPAFGFGGSIDNQQVTGSVRVPFWRNRAYSRQRVSHGARLTRSFPGEVGLKSIWLETTLGLRLPALAPARGVL